MIPNARRGGDVEERAISEIAKQGRGLGFRLSFASRLRKGVDQENIEMAIVVIVEQSHAGTGDLRQVRFERVTSDMPKLGQPRLLGIVDVAHVPGGVKRWLGDRQSRNLGRQSGTAPACASQAENGQNRLQTCRYPHPVHCNDGRIELNFGALTFPRGKPPVSSKTPKTQQSAENIVTTLSEWA